MIANFGMFFGHGQGGRQNMLATLAAVIIAPFAAMIVQMAISRHREYGADRAGAEISGKPLSLASALAKLARGAERVPNPVVDRNPAAAQLYIVPALRGGGGDGLFSTHPATENRIAALQAIAGEMGIVPTAPRTASVPRSASVPSSRRRSSALDPLGRD